MKNMYRSKYITVDYFQEDNLIETFWLPETEKMTEDEYKQEMLNWLDACLKCKPTKNIPNISDMRFVVSPEMQEWTNENILISLLDMGLKWVAIVFDNPDFIAQLSLEQVMEEPKGKEFVTRWFVKKESAIDWLKSVK